MDPVAAYQQTVVWTGQRVAGVRPEDLGLPTPCTEWDVRALLAAPHRRVSGTSRRSPRGSPSPS